MPEIQNEPVQQSIPSRWRHAIIAGVISGVIVLVFVQPILTLPWKYMVTGGGLFVDSFFVLAARGYAERIPFEIFIAIYSIFIGTSVGVLVNTYSKRETRSNFVTRVESSKLSNTFGAGAVLFAGLLLMVTNYLVVQVNTSFHQRLTILAPDISDHDYKVFEAQWAGMKSRNDFRKISDRMDSIAKANGITLPQ